MIVVLALAAVMAGLPGKTIVEYPPMAVGDWTYRIRDDSFTGRRTCRLGSRHAVYRHGVLLFRLGGRVDTAAALYRIDGGPALDPHGDDLAIASAGEPLHADDLDNASAGLIRIPARRLMDAQTLSIRPSPQARVATFPVAGLRAALSQELRYGCPIDTVATTAPALRSKQAATAQVPVDHRFADQTPGFAGGAGSGAR